LEVQKDEDKYSEKEARKATKQIMRLIDRSHVVTNMREKSAVLDDALLYYKEVEQRTEPDILGEVMN